MLAVFLGWLKTFCRYRCQQFQRWDLGPVFQFRSGGLRFCSRLHDNCCDVLWALLWSASSSPETAGVELEQISVPFDLLETSGTSEKRSKRI